VWPPRLLANPVSGSLEKTVQPLVQPGPRVPHRRADTAGTLASTITLDCSLAILAPLFVVHAFLLLLGKECMVSQMIAQARP
jgi:hypothetical protein